MRKIFPKSKNKGFTLVETLVALSIFSVSILGLLVALSQGLADTGYAKKKVAAAYLAQEGIEYIRNMRDTFMIYSNDPQTGWEDFKTHIAACAGGSGCYFNASGLDYAEPEQPINQILLDACPSEPDTCPELLYDFVTGLYDSGLVGGQPTGLVRQIKMEEITPDEVQITSTVFWSQASGNYSIVFSDNLLNWIE